MAIATTTEATWSPELLDLYRGSFSALSAMAERILYRRDLAEEVVQEAFMTYHVRGCQPLPGRERSYLRSIVRNNALSVMRSSWRADRVNRQMVSIDAASAETSAIGEITDRELVGLLKVLPNQQRRALTLRHVVGLSVSQTAEHMGVSAGSVKTHSHRATEAMRRLLDGTSPASDG